MKGRERSVHSLKYILSMLILAVILPMYLCVGVISGFYINLYKEQSEAARENTLVIQLNTLETSLDNIQRTVSNYYTKNLSAGYKKVKNSELELYFFQQHLKSDLDFNSSSHDLSPLFFSYCTDNDYFIISSSGAEISARKESFLDQLMEQEISGSTQWRILGLNQKYYYLSFIKAGDYYVGALVDAGRMLERLTPLNDKNGTQYYILGEENEIIGCTLHADYAVGQNLPDNRTLEKEYQVIDIRSAIGFCLTACSIERDILLNFNMNLFLILALAVSTLFILPAIRWIHKKYVLNPIQHLTIGLERIQNNDFSYRMNEECYPGEFCYLNSTFNDMSRSIYDLKVEVYENKLQAKQQEIELLQDQIKPHFIMNNLNLIYNMAYAQKYGNIQEMVIHLNDYLRYTLRQNLTEVAWKEDLEYAYHYLEIIRLNYPERFRYDILYQPEDGEAALPPFMINTLIENVVKHLFGKKNEIYVLIQGRMIDQEGIRYLECCLLDNGPGFSPEVLADIRDWSPEQVRKENHVGLKNMKSRLYYLYGNEAEFHIQNVWSGAAVWFLIPQKEDNRS